MGDAQLILAFVYGINFGISAKCTMSAYHYNIAVDTMVVALTCITLSAYMRHDFWHGKLAAILRMLIAIAIFAFLLRFLFYQFEMVSNPEYISIPTPNRTDSLLFLPMACFLDRDLNPFRPNGNLTPERKAVVGDSGPRVTPDLVFTVLLVICYLAALCIPSETRRNKAWLSISLNVLVVSVCVASCFWSIIHIFLVRSWVGNSGWMEKTNRPGSLSGNPEDSVAGLGQLLSLANLVWVIVTSLDRHRQPQSRDMSGQP